MTSQGFRVIHEIARGNPPDPFDLLYQRDDPLIPRGDCRVTSRDATVDGSLMARINTIITQFQGDERG